MSVSTAKAAPVSQAKLVHSRLEGVSPLAPDATAPFVPAALAEVLFGGTASTYAILDAAVLPVLPELLDANDLPHACLAPGGASDDLAAVSPWLVQLDPDTPLLRALFTPGDAHMTRFWGKNAGIFLRADARLEAVADHFRRLVKVRGLAGDRVWFRFWDPTVLADYLPATTDWPDRIDSLFASRFLRDPTVIAVDPARERAHVFRPKGAKPASVRFALTDRDMAILALPQVPYLKQELADWLLRLDPGRFRPFGAVRRLAVAEHVVMQGQRYGFTYKEEFAHLLYQMTWLGGWFHVAPDYAAFTAELSPFRAARMPEMSAAFPRVYAEMMPPEDDRAAILTRLAHSTRGLRGRFDKATPEELRAISTIAEGLLPRGVGPDAARAETRATLPDGGLHARALFYLLRLTCGPHPHGDPLHPWIRALDLVTDGQNANTVTAADYCLHRLERMI